MVSLTVKKTFFLTTSLTSRGRSRCKFHLQASRSSNTENILFKTGLLDSMKIAHIVRCQRCEILKAARLASLLGIFRSCPSSSCSSNLLHCSLLHLQDCQVRSSLRSIDNIQGNHMFILLKAWLHPQTPHPHLLLIPLTMLTWTSATASSVVRRFAASDWRCCRIVRALCVFSTMPRMQFNITCNKGSSSLFNNKIFYLDILPLIFLMIPLVRTGQALRLWMGRCRIDARVQRWREEGGPPCPISSSLPASLGSLLSFSHLPFPGLPTLKDLACLHS